MNSEDFENNWLFFKYKTILSYENLQTIYDNIIKSKHIYGSTAEIGVYQGYTSKMIVEITKKTHYCYDTFEGVIHSNIFKGDKHKEGEFSCSLDEVVQIINNKNVDYRKGDFPETFQEKTVNFSFVYSDTTTQYGAKHTLETFAKRISTGGKLLFFIDDKCQGVRTVVDKFIEKDLLFHVEKKNQIIVFTKK